MKKHLMVATVVCFGMMGGIAMAGSQEPSVDAGAQLFASPALGTTGESCAGCHPDGKGLQDAGDNDDAALANIINKCIGKALEGKALAADSPEMSSLILYIRSLGAK